MKIYVTVHDGMIEVYSHTELEVVVIDVDDQSDEDPFWICEKPSNNPDGLIKDLTALATQVDPPELVQDLLAEQGIVIEDPSKPQRNSLNFANDLKIVEDLEKKVSTLSPISSIGRLAQSLYESESCMRTLDRKQKQDPAYAPLYNRAKDCFDKASRIAFSI